MEIWAEKSQPRSRQSNFAELEVASVSALQGLAYVAKDYLPCNGFFIRSIP